MKNLIIIGAGGFGLELYEIAKDSKGYNSEFTIKGFIDDNITEISASKHMPPVLSTISDYTVETNDVFVCSLGDVKAKKKISQFILNRGGCFINLIHNSSIVYSNLDKNVGIIVGPNVTIGSNCKIGNHTLLQTGVILGHDSCIGDWTRLDSYVVIVGGVIIKDSVSVHTSAVINNNVVLENEACVGALSFVVRNVMQNTTVYGNPAKKL